jgi:prephenate dehydrogenase
VAAANPFLFKNKPYILCPDMNTDEAAFLTIMNIVQELGAIPVSIDPEEHDLVMAMVSHAPQLVAVALMQAAVKLDSTHGILDMVAGSGFMDMTRIAASGFDMWKGILNTNQDAVESALDAFEESLSELRTALKEGDPSPLWDSARRRRKEMGPRKPNRYCERDLRIQIDALDAQLLKIVRRRLQVVEMIGAAKQKKGLPVFDAKREVQVLEHWSEFGEAFGLSDALINDLLSVLTDHSKRAQS